jgi:predicted nuclease with TOPRIM domain
MSVPLRFKEVEGNMIVPKEEFAALIDAKNRSMLRAFDQMKAHELAIEESLLELTKENYRLKAENKRLISEAENRNCF